MEMSRFIYERSVSYCGHLIIPFVYSIVNKQEIYSYSLLSEFGHRGKFHKVNNPSQLYSNTIEGIITIAKEHLDKESDIISDKDYFKKRYTYRDNLIIIHEMNTKFYYDHYAPNSLNNLAAPRIFRTDNDCIKWVKEGLDRHQVKRI